MKNLIAVLGSVMVIGSSLAAQAANSCFITTLDATQPGYESFDGNVEIVEANGSTPTMYEVMRAMQSDDSLCDSLCSQNSDHQLVNPLIKSFVSAPLSYCSDGSDPCIKSISPKYTPAPDGQGVAGNAEISGFDKQWRTTFQQPRGVKTQIHFTTTYTRAGYDALSKLMRSLPSCNGGSSQPAPAGDPNAGPTHAPVATQTQPVGPSGGIQRINTQRGGQ